MAITLNRNLPPLGIRLVFPFSILNWAGVFTPVSLNSLAISTDVRPSSVREKIFLTTSASSSAINSACLSSGSY